MTTLYTTPQVLAALGVTRQALHLWGAEPDERAPGGSGVRLWSRATIERLAAEHGRSIDWDAMIVRCECGGIATRTVKYEWVEPIGAGQRRTGHTTQPMCHQCTRDTYHGADTFVVSDMPLR